MTTVYGSWKPNSSTNKRMRLRLVYNVPTPTLGQSSVTVTGTVYIEAGYSIYDVNNTFAWSGSLLGSGSAAKSIDVATWGSQQIHSFSKSVSLTSSRQSKSVSFSLTGIDYLGASNKVTVSATVTIPARAITAPNAPTGVSCSRVSDTRHNVAWAATATADRPIGSFEIQRQHLSSGTTSYFPAATVAGSARAWVDTATKANDRINWRIRARNAAGVSGWVYSGYAFTTPAAASSVAVSRVGTDASVAWVVNARDASHQDLQSQESGDGGVTWSGWSYVTGYTAMPASTNSRTVSGLDTTKVHRFRVRTARTNPGTTDGTTLYAVSGASNTLQLLTAPLAPSLASLGTVSDQEATVLRWTHRPVDTTDQTAAEVEWRASGESTWTTIAVTGNAQETTLAAGALPLGGVEWRARTKGQHVDWSPWSAVGSFTVAQPPAVSITDPVDSSTIASNRLTMTVAYADPQSSSMTGWHAELSEGGQVIETLTGSGSVSSVTFATQLDNLTSYSAAFRATAGTGLQSATASVDVSVDFLPPPVPLLDASWDEPSGTTQLAATVPAAGVGEEPATSVRIERSDDGGASWTVIADDLPLGAGVGDDRVALNLDALYRAVSISDLGVETEGAPMPVTTASWRVWLQASGGKVHVLGNAQLAPSFDHEKVTERYIGRTLPTAHYGIGETLRVTVSGVWAEPDEIGQDVTPVLREDVWFRDPAGRAFWATVEDMATPQPWSGRRDVSFTVEKVDVDG